MNTPADRQYKCRTCENEKSFIKLIDDTEFDLIKCLECGFIFREEKIKKDYPQINLGDISPQKSAEREKLYNRFHNRFRQICSYRGRPGRILDIGCGWGDFLNIAKEDGWDVYGLDIDAKRVEFSRRMGLKVYQGEVMNVDLEENSFDVVCLFHTLEHIFNINQTFSKVYKILKEDGLLAIEIPTIGSLKAKIYGRYWSYIVPEHINYFTPRVIKNLLEKEGFKILKTQFYSTSEIMGTLNVITHRHISYRWQDKLRFLSPVKSICESIFSLPYFGDTLVIYAKKFPMVEETA